MKKDIQKEKEQAMEREQLRREREEAEALAAEREERKGREQAAKDKLEDEVYTDAVMRMGELKASLSDEKLPGEEVEKAIKDADEVRFLLGTDQFLETNSSKYFLPSCFRLICACHSVLQKLKKLCLPHSIRKFCQMKNYCKMHFHN